MVLDLAGQRIVPTGRVAKTLTDPVFGKLRWSGYDIWEGARATRQSKRFGASLWVDGTAPCEAPSAKQQDTYRMFRKEEAELWREAQNALVRYYNKVKPAYREGRDPDSIERYVPDLKKPSDIWHLLEHVRIYIPIQRPRVRLVKLLANCEWDMEHGIAVTIQNEKVRKVALQGEG